MLEIKNVTKTYRPKKGVPVKALDDVSLKFADKGMVFILGKSGSGKSTLLNVLGGLDLADSGEFIIKGKSSKNFSQSDFDSYRNTFIGFIFQEYNILPEFSIGANIALAMELQGKKATEQALNDILEQVDLSGYASRKPNELSGGQKQRVAIARALIKSPEIIMADEPTGALDSKTGKQVFDTLKKLSKEKLVLIVSHDREFAEQYADRIIELKDGAVLSDVSKTSLPPTAISEGMSVVEGGFITIKKGYRLTNKDLEMIASYVEGASGDTLISIDEKKLPELKKLANINEEGGKDSFTDTKEEDVRLKQYTKEDSKLKKSRLPFSKSLKIGASSLKIKPIRLVFTIFLCFIAFTLFGLADTLASYNKSQAYISSMTDGNIKNASFSKTVEFQRENYSYFQDFLLTEEDVSKIGRDTGLDVLPVYTGNETWQKGYSFSNLIAYPNQLQSNNGISLYNSKISGYAEYTPQFMEKAGLTIIVGKLPSANDEIAIPKFLFEQMKIGGLLYLDEANQQTRLEPEQITDENVLVNRKIDGKTLGFSRDMVEPRPLKIVGIFDTHFDTSKYSSYLPGAQQTNENLMTYLVSAEIEATRDYGFHCVVAVNEGYLETLVQINQENKQTGVGINPNDFSGYISLNSGNYGMGVNRIARLSQRQEITSEQIQWISQPKTTLQEGEIVVPYGFSDGMGDREMQASTITKLEEALEITLEDFERDEIRYRKLQEYYFENTWAFMPFAKRPAPASYLKRYAQDAYGVSNDEYETWFTDLYEGTKDEFLNNASKDYANRLLGEYLYDNPYEEITGKAIIMKALSVIYVEEGVTSQYPTSGMMNVNSVASAKNIPYTVVGYYVSTQAWDSPVFVSDEIYDLFGSVEKGTYGFAIAGINPQNEALLEKTVNFSLTNFDGSLYHLQNEASVVLEYVGEIVEDLAEVFLYIGIGFAIFACLMLFNFISVSISNKKREIGILRAVGARSSDVFGIFFNESMLITLINFLLSAIATFTVCIVLNGVFRGYGLPVTLLTFGIRQIGLLLGMGVLVAFIGSFLPVMKISRKRPIDAIQNR